MTSSGAHAPGAHAAAARGAGAALVADAAFAGHVHQLLWLPALKRTCSGVARLLRRHPCICCVRHSAPILPLGSLTPHLRAVALQPSTERALALRNRT